MHRLFCNSLRLWFSPQLFQPLGATATVFVEIVADGVLFVEVLMVLLGGIELRGHHNLRDDRLFESSRLLDRLFGGVRLTLLFVGLKENGGAILAAVVAELCVRCDRIDVAPKSIQ